MPFIDTTRGRFFYRLATGTDPTLIFLHGNLGNSLWWRPVLDLLPEGWRGIAYDAIGFGHSERTNLWDRYTIPALAADLAALLEALVATRVHLVAHSTSAPVALEFAWTHPTRVATLTLVGPPPASGSQTPAEAFPLLERLPRDAQMLKRALAASAPSLDPESPRFAQLMEEAAKIDGMALVAIARGLDAWEPGERLRELTLPVLLVRGEKDIMLDEEEAHHTLLSIPGANHLEVFRSVGHSPMLETPNAFTEALVAFIAEDWEYYEAAKSAL
ncbi:MAG: alpha/beta hydrolase [Chloroflexi bacterium]|nr:alpha/beta hydrolase [Chloroflexota bacterium]